MSTSLEKLLSVQDAFEIKGRGVALLPTIPKTEFRSQSMQMFVLVRKPGGAESRTYAEFTMPTVAHPENLCFVCLLRSVTKEDVPLGSEIFRFVETDEKA